MSYCSCEQPLEYRITSENTGDDFLYLRCNECHGKAGRVDIDIDAFTDHITNPEELDPHDPEVAKTVVEHGHPTVSLLLDATDSPFMFTDDNSD